VILTIWGPLFIDFVKLSCPVGVSPTYIPSIYTEHAGGDDQIIRDPVFWDTVTGDVSVEKGVAADVTPGVRAGIPGNVPVGCVVISVGEE
jgi:hypothetical protein